MASTFCYQESDASPDPRLEESKVQTSVVQEFLELNKVTKEWCNFILEKPDIKIALYNSIGNLSTMSGYVPDKDCVLKALTFRDPEDIKVVILGHSPISKPDLATGLAFSLPSHSIDTGMSESDITPGVSVLKLHKVIAKVNNLEEDKAYDTDHEDWAKEGVLLLNAALTYTARPIKMEDYELHFQRWRGFTFQLLSHLLNLHIKEKKKLSVLCWGTNAENIGRKFSGKDGIYFVDFYDVSPKEMSAAVADQSIVCVGHHPTFPREGNRFQEQAFTQFQEIKKIYPELFHLKAEKDVSTETCRTVQELTKIDEKDEARKENIYRQQKREQPSKILETDIADTTNNHLLKQRKLN